MAVSPSSSSSSSSSSSTTTTRSSGFLVILTRSSPLLSWVLCLSLAGLVLSPLPLASAKSVGRTERWFNPCSGSRSIAFEMDLDDEVSKVDLVAAFDMLAKRSVSLKRRVRTTRTRYIDKRFRDESVVQDFDTAGFRIDGMPSTHSATVSSIGHAEVTQTIHEAFDDLARVAVFVDQARIGEALATNENLSFEKDFQTIEDHQEDGLYFLLCYLHRVIHSTGKPLSDDTYNGIMNLKIHEVDKNALRHTRDYLVLRDFEKILERLSMHFEALKQIHSN